MAYENLSVEREENTGIITLNRPPANPASAIRLTAEIVKMLETLSVL